MYPESNFLEDTGQRGRSEPASRAGDQHAVFRLAKAAGFWEKPGYQRFQRCARQRKAMTSVNARPIEQYSVAVAG